MHRARLRRRRLQLRLRLHQQRQPRGQQGWACLLQRPSVLPGQQPGRDCVAAAGARRAVLLQLQRRRKRVWTEVPVQLASPAAGPPAGDAQGCPARRAAEVSHRSQVAKMIRTPTVMRYSTARSGLLYAARRARMTCSLSKPMEIISLTALSSAEPVTKPVAPPAVSAAAGAAGVAAAAAAVGVASAMVVSAAGWAAGAPVDGAAGVAVDAGAASAAGAAAAAGAGADVVADVEAAGVALGWSARESGVEIISLASDALQALRNE